MNADGNNVPVNDQEKQEKLRALEEFLKNRGPDETHVRQIEQNVEVRLAGTRLYIPAFTKSWMDKKASKPVMAVTIQTDATTGTVYFWPSLTGERKLVISETMGGASVAFGVPLTKLNLKFPASRRIVLPLHCDELPTMGPVFSVSFAELAHEGRNVDKELLAAAKQVKTELQKARKESRIKRTLSKLPKPDTSTNP
jgi:hypothetical protein